MTVPTALRLFTFAVLLVLLPVNDAQTPTCRQYTYMYESVSGSISSPGYPSSYGNYQSCYNYIDAPSLSTITIDFNALGLEQHATCGYDWIEFICMSNSISRPVRYCGSGYRAPLIFKPCSRVSMRFSSDAMITGSGFSVFFYIQPISCQGNCTPVASGAGYNCSCDANQTPYIAPPYNQCPTGCSDSSTYCSCSSPQTTTTTTTTTLPPTTTSYLGCGQRTTNGLRGNITSPNYPYDYSNNQYCNNFIVAPSLSTITITFNVLGLEQHSDCYYDWIELSCMSNSNIRPVRYCGSGYRSPLSFKPCSRVSVMFASDGYLTGIGFLVSYDIEPISCQGNCTPVVSGAGYNCTCDANQTPYIAPPYNQCPTGCTAFSTLCVCSSPQTIPPSSTTTTTTLPTTTTSYSACRQSTINGLRGNVTSPNYPNYYGNSQSCNNYIEAPSLSTITITFNALGLEEHATCGYDWIEFTCQSNSNIRPVRYCGSGYRSQLSFKPCSRVFMRFSSDGMVTGTGFSVSYDIEPIRCQGNCNPVASGSGYNCTCDANQTPYIAPPYNQCPTGCSDSSSYCTCSSPQAVTPASTTTTTTTTTIPSTTRPTTLPSTTTRLPSTTTTVPRTTTTSYSVCGQRTFSGLRGNITSPNYPYSYPVNQFCNYSIVPPSLSSINFTFNVIGIEPHATCNYDWIEFTCESNSIIRQVRYCGSGYRPELSIMACSRVSITFSSDRIYTYSGFSLSYEIEPISCQGNCTPVANGAGYNCSCDANQTPYIASPYNQCPTGCSDSSTYCICSSPNTTTSRPPSTTTTTTSLPTTRILQSGCKQNWFSGLRGNITSPNYPNYYQNNQFCSYTIVAQSLSSINFTFNVLGLEPHATCGYDWIEFTCESNPIIRPIRYCGSGSTPELSIKPCSRVSMRFSSDKIYTGIGFSVSYEIEPISCQGNCTPVANGAGYNCSCDDNQSPFIAPPYNQCPTECSDSATYCACSLPFTNTTTSPSNTSTEPPYTTPLYEACGQSTFSGLRGNITSPNYPNYYQNNQFCNYSIVAPALSTINFTFHTLVLEYQYSCTYDWIEFTCESNPISRPVRYCGSGYRPELSIKPCSRVSMRFSSDRFATAYGFSVSYDIEPISCQGNCTPVAIGTGYNCTCDANQTPYIAPPFNQCPDGCFNNSTYCACSLSFTNATTSPFNTTTSPPRTTTLYSACGQSTFSGLRGNITSPGYPYSYQINQFCNYSIVTPSLSSINFTFNALGLEQHYYCSYDWIEFTCESNPTIRPVRYCGSGSRPELSIKPCSRVSMRFSSDRIGTGIGFSVSYEIEPISCQGNCTPVANGTGYNCPCDANQTAFIAPPYNQCPDGCFSYSTYCACSQSITNATTSPFNTTISTPRTTTLYSGNSSGNFSQSTTRMPSNGTTTLRPATVNAGNTSQSTTRAI